MNQIWLNAVRASARAAVAPWWLAGGAPMPLAAYQPINAVDYAASLVNLANPGTFNAAPGVTPTWASGTGWGFNGTTQHLTTGITAQSGVNYIFVIRFSNLDSGDSRSIFGAVGNVDWRIEISPIFSGGNGRYIYTSVVDTSAASATAGVVALSNTNVYLNGSSVTSFDPTSITSTSPHALFIGARNNNGVANQHALGNIQAVAIYSSTLTASQVAAVSAAMAAL